jgi:predicted Rossmann-fold nucleotide-binding protein
VKGEISRGGRHRRPIVTVIGSGTIADAHSEEVGQLIAALGFDLLTGGGGGVMEAVSRAFFAVSPRDGRVIGIVPGTVTPLEGVEQRDPGAVQYSTKPGYPNAWVEIAIFTHLPDSGAQGTLRSSRNHINVLSADAIVALPGEEGTVAEMWLAVQYGVPIVAYGGFKNQPPYGIDLARSRDEIENFLSKV